MSNLCKKLPLKHKMLLGSSRTFGTCPKDYAVFNTYQQFKFKGKRLIWLILWK